MTAPAGGAPLIGLISDSVATASRRIGCHAADVRAAYASSQAGLDAGLYGCVGRSGEELAALGQRWASIALQHGERLDALSRDVGAAGATLTDSDHANAERIGNVTDA